MGRITLAGCPPIDIALRRSARAKRLSLRISQLDGRVTLTLPRRVSDAEGRAFAVEKETWLRRHLTARPEEVRVHLGAQIPIEGQTRTVMSAQGRSVTLDSAHLFVGGAEETIGKRVETFLKLRARDKLANASDHYAAKLQKEYSRLTLRDTRSRWGSCSSAGALMYSWRLVLAPPDVLNYVAAHEVAHLAHMDHSARFWSEVERLYGDYSNPRAWLRTHGAALHRYRFTT